jgi:putative CocE/NonD family hydrolase
MDASQPTYQVAVESHVKVRVRDRVHLDATIWRPAEPGRYPVIMERTPYELTRRCSVNAEFYARRGYAFVGQSLRGAHASEGVYAWSASDGWGEPRDGYDSVEWAGTQTWSNGKVGMVDGSISGATQYLVAPTRPPHLQALFVRQASTLSHTFFFRGGAFRYAGCLGAITRHVLDDFVLPQGTRSRLQLAVEQLTDWQRHLPLKDFPPLRDVPAGSIYFDLLDHPNDGAWWWDRDLSRRYAEIDLPIFHLASWFDLFLGPQLEHFQGIRSRARSPRARRGQRLLIGPWMHAPENVGRRSTGELDFGPEAELDLAAFRLPWFDYWLKGIDTGVQNGPPVRAFLMGANRWLDFDSWPPDDVTYTPLFLHGEGTATFDAPDSIESADSYEYDPERPVPSLVAYPDYGPHDYQQLEERMITYTSAPLEHELVLVGPVCAILYASSSAPDTDWVVRLCDVYPDGRSMSVCDGILRGRYRDSTQQPELMDPGRVYRFEVDLWSTAQSFPSGHRLRVEVTSSDFPRYDRNLNTGGIFGEEVTGEVAVNTIYHDRIRPSQVLLPVLTPRTDGTDHISMNG